MELGSEKLNGYVRPLVTIAFTAVIVYGFIAGTIKPGEFFPFATGVIVYWFKTRDEAKKNGQATTDAQKT